LDFSEFSPKKEICAVLKEICAVFEKFYGKKLCSGYFLEK
jgi:hypothetical protein